MQRTMAATTQHAQQRLLCVWSHRSWKVIIATRLEEISIYRLIYSFRFMDMYVRQHTAHTLLVRIGYASSKFLFWSKAPPQDESIGRLNILRISLSILQLPILV